MENKHIQKEEKEMERKKETLIAKRTRKKTYPSIHLKKNLFQNDFCIC